MPDVFGVVMFLAMPAMFLPFLLATGIAFGIAWVQEHKTRQESFLSGMYSVILLSYAVVGLTAIFLCE